MHLNRHLLSYQQYRKSNKVSFHPHVTLLWDNLTADEQKEVQAYVAHDARFHMGFNGAAILITADHGMNPKKRCWDLAKACEARGFELKFAVSPVTDRLLKHHRGFGGVSYVYLHSIDQVSDAIDVLMGLRGVEDVLPRELAATRFRLMKERIGDLVVIPDKDTVFGDLQEEIETLAPNYRSHGSLYEMDIPLLIYNVHGDMPPTDAFRKNLDLTRMLYR